jgi:putative Mg2+ transporter-C (MgtC) family protein
MQFTFRGKFGIMSCMNPYDAIPRIFLALVLGALIGLEREYTQKHAGLRTHILVTLGATIFTWVSLSDFYHGLSVLPFAPTDENRIVRDPSRVAAQIVTGIGFIGGGAVLRYGTTVRGLTTAASLWTMASIGMLIGIGQYRLSIVATLVTFLVLFTIGKFERHFFSKHLGVFNRVKVNIIARTGQDDAAQKWMEQHYRDKIIEAKVRSDSQTEKVEMNYILNTLGKKLDVNEISRNLSHVSGVISTVVKAYTDNSDVT